MNIDFKWWSIMAIVVIGLIAVLIISGDATVKSIEGCKTLRIRPFSKEFFTWNGIVELNNSKQYQPSCL